VATKKTNNKTMLFEILSNVTKVDVSALNKHGLRVRDTALIKAPEILNMPTTALPIAETARPVQISFAICNNDIKSNGKIFNV
jgi:hypothetical protein